MSTYSISIRFILTIILVCFPVFAMTQEKSHSPEKNHVIETSKPSGRSAIAKDREHLPRINHVIESLGSARDKPTVSGSVDAVRFVPGARSTIHIRHVVDWVEFVDKVRLEKPLDFTLPDASEQLKKKLKPKMHFKLFEKPIISQGQVNAALKSCHPNLQAPLKKLRPPFYNNWTGIHWVPENDYLAIEATAVVDAENNKCVKGIVDLRTSEVVCISDMACMVK